MRRTSIKILIGADGLVTSASEIPAYVFGQWAAHRVAAGIYLNEWDVTHVPSGTRLRSVAAQLDRADAIKLARALDRRTVEAGEPAAQIPSKDHQDIIMSTVAEYLGEGRCL